MSTKNVSSFRPKGAHFCPSGQFCAKMSQPKNEATSSLSTEAADDSSLSVESSSEETTIVVPCWIVGSRCSVDIVVVLTTLDVDKCVSSSGLAGAHLEKENAKDVPIRT